MKTKLLIACTSFAIAGAGLAACEQQREEGTLTEEPAIEDEYGTDDARLASWQATVSPATTTSTVSASATIRATREGDTDTALSIEGGEPGHSYPWHIHSGRCGSGGKIVGDETAYQPVNTNDAGEGEGQATLSVSLDPEADYHVKVHASSEDLGTIVACGEVEAEQEVGAQQ